LGTPQGDQYFSRTGLLPSAARISITVPLSIGFVTPWEVCCPPERVPQPRCSIASRLYHYNGLGCIPFRSPLLRKSLLLSFPRGTEMFQFPRFPPLGLCVQPRVTGHLPLPGFPIRRSTDRSLVGGSPWLIAATHVLHRHLAPRHPPLALCSLESSRCSCSLCSSQGAGASKKIALGHGEVMCTLRRRTRKEAARRPLLQNGIVMTAEPRLGLPTLEKHIEAPPS
jgi:hypothetical protein